MQIDPMSPEISRQDMRLFFEAGIVSATDIIAWADARIAEDDCPSEYLIDLSLSKVGDVSKLLSGLPPAEESFNLIERLYREHLISLEKSWELILKTFDRSLMEFPVDGLWEIYNQANDREEFSSLPDAAKELLHAILTSPTETHAS